MPTCPRCGHTWYERNARIKDSSDLAAQIDERLAAFGDAAGDVRRFLACARSARSGGMAAGKTLTLLSDFYALHIEDPATFGYALHQVLVSDTFDWKRPNLFGYLKAIYQARRAKGGVVKVEDQADEIALVMLGVWHRFANLARLTEASFGDIAHGATVRRVAWALKKMNRLPATAPTHAQLAGDVRRVLAWAEAKRRKLVKERLDRIEPVPGDTAATVKGNLAPELADLQAALAARKATNDAIEREVWGES